MYTNTGLRFLRVLARRDERVPSYLDRTDTDGRGAQHVRDAKPHTRDEAAGHARIVQR